MGTRGDIQPFTALGKLLKENGHRVRLATHVMYRPIVLEADLEFYPLGGDPMKLSAYMVKTSGRIFPKVSHLLRTRRSSIALLSSVFVFVLLSRR